MLPKGITHNLLSLEERYNIIQDVNNGMKQSEAVRKYNATKQNVYNVTRADKKAEVVSAYEANAAAAKVRKSLKGAEINEKLDGLLYEWFLNKRALDKKINNNLLLVTRRLMADKLGLQS